MKQPSKHQTERAGEAVRRPVGKRLSQLMFLADEYALAKGAADVEYVSGGPARFVHQEAEEKAARQALVDYATATLAKTQRPSSEPASQMNPKSNPEQE